MLDRRMQAIEMNLGGALAALRTRTEERLRCQAEATEARVGLAINEAISYAAEHLGGVTREMRDQRQHLPAFLNATATVPALGHELKTLKARQNDAIAAMGDLEERVLESVRRLGRGQFEAIEKRMIATDLRNEQLAGFLGRFESSLINRDTETAVALRSLGERLADADSRKDQLAEDVGKLFAGLQSQAEQSASEVRRLSDALANGQTDRGDLWRSAEQATRAIGDLWSRVEFVRKEIMYEMRFAIKSSADFGSARVSRIVNEEKVEAARLSDDIRLNLGCGHLPLPGYLNVDFRDLPGVDIVADAGELPFEPGSVREIVSFHVLEHFPQEALRRLLSYWRSLLTAKGVFKAVVPDGEAMLQTIAAGTYSFEDFRMVLFGAQEYEGDFHFNMFTPDSLEESLMKAGFQDIAFPAKGRKNNISFEFEVIAKAP